MTLSLVMFIAFKLAYKEMYFDDNVVAILLKQFCGFRRSHPSVSLPEFQQTQWQSDGP